MADAPRITIRLAPKLLKAAESRAKAASVTLGEYVRGLVEVDTGVSVDMPRGLAALAGDNASKKNIARHKSISRKGARERWGESEK